MNRGRDGQERFGRGEEIPLGIRDLPIDVEFNDYPIGMDEAIALVRNPRTVSGEIRVSRLNLAALAGMEIEEPEEEQSCQNCKWWDQNDLVMPTDHDYWDIGKDWGACVRATAAAPLYVDNNAGTTAMSYCFDPVENSFLFTSPEHCCSMWEAEE